MHLYIPPQRRVGSKCISSETTHTNQNTVLWLTFPTPTSKLQEGFYFKVNNESNHLYSLRDSRHGMAGQDNSPSLQLQIAHPFAVQSQRIKFSLMVQSTHLCKLGFTWSSCKLEGRVAGICI